MTFEEFISVTHEWWSWHLKKVDYYYKRGELIQQGGSGRKILYPSILLVSNISGYYVAELLGAKEEFQELKVKITLKSNSIYQYLSQFDVEEHKSVFHIDSDNIMIFSNMCLAHPNEQNELNKRFPFIELYPTQFIVGNGYGSVLSFGDKFKSCIINNSAFINKHSNMFRCKSILLMFIGKSNISTSELLDYYSENVEDSIKGIHVALNNEERVLVAGHLQHLYLASNIHETTIGEYLKLHPDIIRKAFKTDRFEYEPSFDWIEHDGTCKDKAINPDLMVQREDGFFDIYDLKKALLTKNSLTKGDRSRRTFISEVESGIAQLANYAEYFTYYKNAEFAKNKYGILVKKPKLVLIIGSFENSNIEEIEQACRKYKEEISIIDYDTFCHMFIGTQ